ncbi:transcription factor like protein [Arabidopsis thaliana]|nr:transcription factor like protein [Arabidopsis thaliana]CAB78657.1 transcription factor like protein [Arabidopsis thaliana]
MAGVDSGKLIGSEIHGFHTLQDLDIQTMLDEAYSRWLRPNEIHALLCGTIVLFDRKMLRNFRKDGHNWKKKKDGKTIKEAHEHLKVSFLNVSELVMRKGFMFIMPTVRIPLHLCEGVTGYWISMCQQTIIGLSFEEIEHIVLVHYRETHEVHAAPATPGNSYSSSITDHLSPKIVAEDTSSGVHNTCNTGEEVSLDDLELLRFKVLVLGSRNHEIRLHEINTLDWDELLVPADISNQSHPTEGTYITLSFPLKRRSEDMLYFTEQLQTAPRGSVKQGNHLAGYNGSVDIPSFPGLEDPVYQNNNSCGAGEFSSQHSHCGVDPNLQRRDFSATVTDQPGDALLNNGYGSQDSFGRWVNNFISDSPGSVDDPSLEAVYTPGQDSSTPPTVFHSHSDIPEQVFNITDVSPAWGVFDRENKGFSNYTLFFIFQHLGRSNLICICGELRVPAEFLQMGVYRCFLPPQSPGVVNLYLSVDGNKPISQLFSFEHRSVQFIEKAIPQDDQLYKWEEFEFQVRLAHLLFTSSNKISVLTSKISPENLLEAKKLASRTSHLLNSWAYLMKSIQANEVPFDQARDHLFELTLKNRLKEWLLEKVIENRNTKEYDSKGLGVIHLCAVLGYTWVGLLFIGQHTMEENGGCSSICGARPNLVTDPTKEFLGGCTAADLAQQKGYDGLAAFLAEKCLVAQFKDMQTAGNISGNLETIKAEKSSNPGNANEEEQSLKDTLAAYRTAAEAAARIQGAFREHELKVRSSAVRFASKEEEAKNIIAAMKIQHAFRNFEVRRKIAAAARIQYRFQTWKMRREFLNMRKKAIRIQVQAKANLSTVFKKRNEKLSATAAFRGFQVRRQYQKITWSVGVLEKAILRWRLKRKGFRGLQVSQPDEKEGSEAVEDFYKTSQKQAEERLERSVVKVQAMFRSKKAQQDYRRMKLAHEEAQVKIFCCFLFSLLISSIFVID